MRVDQDTISSDHPRIGPAFESRNAGLHGVPLELIIRIQEDDVRGIRQPEALIASSAETLVTLPVQTIAPAASATAAVSSIDPSSTTIVSIADNDCVWTLSSAARR